MVAFSKLPVMMSDEDVVDKRYENGKIYVVRCKNNPNLIYVGSTITTLGQRFTNHKISKKCSLYKYVNGDWDNWFIELYENYPCKNKYQLRRREGELIRQIATINKVIPGRNVKEWYKDNREVCLENMKQHYQDNREKIKEYYQDNREKIKEYGKQRYQDNSQKIKEYGKQRYQNNREKIAEKHKQKITCDICGSIVRKGDFATHKKTKKCINYKK